MQIAQKIHTSPWFTPPGANRISRRRRGERIINACGQQLVSNFFTAQIEANKLVQYALLSEWRRVGNAPDHTPVDLANTIRPELDAVDKTLIAELDESTATRASASCRIEIAKAVGIYVSAHKNSLGTIKAISLDRALATACIGPRNWRLEILGSQGTDRWEMKITGPNGFERSYTLEGGIGQHEPNVVAAIIARMLPARV